MGSASSLRSELAVAGFRGEVAHRYPRCSEDGLNLYEYVRSNPVNRIDPLGLGGDFTVEDMWHDYRMLKAEYEAGLKKRSSRTSMDHRARATSRTTSCS